MEGLDWNQAVAAIRGEDVGVPSVLAADRAAEIIVEHVRELVDLMTTRHRVLAVDALLTALEGVAGALRVAAEPDRPRRGDVLAVMFSFLLHLRRWAPVAARALLDESAATRANAAHVVGWFVEVPSIVRSARRWATGHPDAKVRELLVKR